MIPLVRDTDDVLEKLQALAYIYIEHGQQEGITAIIKQLERLCEIKKFPHNALSILLDELHEYWLFGHDLNNPFDLTIGAGCKADIWQIKIHNEGLNRQSANPNNHYWRINLEIWKKEDTYYTIKLPRPNYKLQMDIVPIEEVGYVSGTFEGDGVGTPLALTIRSCTYYSFELLTIHRFLNTFRRNCDIWERKLS